MDDLCDTNIENAGQQKLFSRTIGCVQARKTDMTSLNGGRISETQTADGSVNAAEVFSRKK